MSVETQNFNIMKNAATSGKNNNQTGKWWIAGITLGLLMLVAFILGLWAANPTDGIGATIVNWPGQIWQQLLEAKIGTTLGSGLAQQSPWALARIGGVMAYLLSFAAVALGLLNSLRWLRNYFNAATTIYLHKILSLLSVAFLMLHLAGLALDSYLNISLLNSLIPFSTANYRPIWTGLGTIALYMTAAVIVTAYMANRLGYKVWRTTHYLTFAIFFLSLLHGIMTGSDSNGLWMELTYVVTTAIVVYLSVIRFFATPTTKAKVAKTVK